jgi:benzaldehyde dehydrogenase (NAD)
VTGDERFAPVVAVIRARDETDAIRPANDRDRGLATALFTRDMARTLRVDRQIRSGIFHIHEPTVHDEARRPFGGKAGNDQFAVLRWISPGTQPGHVPTWRRPA